MDKKRYRISTGLWDTDIKSFSSDKAAWEALRKILPNKFATLYRYDKIPILDRDTYVKEYTSKYGTHADGKFTPSPVHETRPVPIYIGLTSSRWKVE